LNDNVCPTNLFQFRVLSFHSEVGFSLQ
jgi:hypothetical protein